MKEIVVTATDTRAAGAGDTQSSMEATAAQRHIRELINELDEGIRSAQRELESDVTWIRRMQDQVAAHLDALMLMRATLDAIQSWIGDD